MPNPGKTTAFLHLNAKRHVLRTAKQYLLHFGYEGRLSTAGNLAFPFTPPEIGVGPAYEFSVYHLMDVERQEDVFFTALEQL